MGDQSGAAIAESGNTPSHDRTGRNHRGSTDALAQIVDALGPEQVMFEAADPKVFAGYVKIYGPVGNLFLDHRQVIQLESLRSGIWCSKS